MNHWHWHNAKVTPPPRLFWDSKIENVQRRNKLLRSSPIFATQMGEEPDTGLSMWQEYEVHIKNVYPD